jgi:hypothetical protein
MLTAQSAALTAKKEFFTKALRHEHQRKSHPEKVAHPVFKELDGTAWRQIKAQLKCYTDSIKTEIDPIAPRREWVQANTPRFEVGRSKTRANAQLELGQWYSIATFLGANVIENPCK